MCRWQTSRWIGPAEAGHYERPTSIIAPPMPVLSHGLSYIDLEFIGRSHAIASAIVQSSGGVAIVDPGPTTCLSTLELGLQQHGVRWPDVRHILLTHIH